MKIQSAAHPGMAGYTSTSPRVAENAGNAGGAPTAAAPVAAPSPDEVAASVDKINRTIRSLDRNLEFSFDKDARMNVVKVVDSQTRDVIRQFPSEQVLGIAKALGQLQGMLFRAKA